MINKMSCSKNDIINKIKGLKHENFGSVVVSGKITDVDFKLILLSADCITNQGLMELIGRWRKENEMWFLSQFKVTTERTTKWFKSNVIENQDRLLFVVEAGNQYIGHVGLFRFDFTNKTCEIDNIVRGEPEYPGIMGNAVLKLMKWGREHLCIERYKLKVRSDNTRAIRFYKHLGFSETSRIPLMRIEGNDGPEWSEAPFSSNANIFYIVMKSSDDN